MILFIFWYPNILYIYTYMNFKIPSLHPKKITAKAPCGRFTVHPRRALQLWHRFGEAKWFSKKKKRSPRDVESLVKTLGFMIFIYIYISGQIIVTSHDLTPNGGLVREIPLFQGYPGWWNTIIWPDICICVCMCVTGLCSVMSKWVGWHQPVNV